MIKICLQLILNRYTYEMITIYQAYFSEKNHKTAFIYLITHCLLKSILSTAFKPLNQFGTLLNREFCGFQAATV